MTLDARPRQVGRFALWRGLGGRISGHSQTDVLSLNAAGDLPYEDYGDLIDRPIGIEDGSTAPHVHDARQGGQAPWPPEKT